MSPTIDARGKGIWFAATVSSVTGARNFKRAVIAERPRDGGRDGPDDRRLPDVINYRFHLSSPFF
jgi:hypothetical protein